MRVGSVLSDVALIYILCIVNVSYGVSMHSMVIGFPDTYLILVLIT